MLAFLMFTCPPAYAVMKAAAVDRHVLVSKYIEGRDGALGGWHDDILTWVYPL